MTVAWPSGSDELLLLLLFDLNDSPCRSGLEKKGTLHSPCLFCRCLPSSWQTSNEAARQSEKQLLFSVDGAVPAGALCALMGPSGSGELYSVYWSLPLLVLLLMPLPPLLLLLMLMLVMLMLILPLLKQTLLSVRVVGRRLGRLALTNTLHPNTFIVHRR